MAAKATRYGHLSGEEGYEFDGEKGFELRKKMNETTLSDTKKNVKPGQGAAKNNVELGNYLFVKQQLLIALHNFYQVVDLVKIRNNNF